jgi:predicted regulator of Ras-like GTPase activity (Roadblock/LC7/MglB family)
MPRKKIQQIEKSEQADLTSKNKTKEQSSDLASTLDEIKAQKGVIGYILRADTSAAVDMKDPSKIIDYAILSSSALESAEKISTAFKLGKIDSIVVECIDLKALLVTVGDHRVSVFMKKSMDHRSIYNELM